jgi:centractin
VDAINRTDLDLRKSLFGNIVLSGGSTLTKGFGDRLLHEVQRLAVKDMRIKIFAPPERKYSTWIGGSILAGLSTFRKVCEMLMVRIPWLQTTDFVVDVGQYRRLARKPRYHPHEIHIILHPHYPPFLS